MSEEGDRATPDRLLVALVVAIVLGALSLTSALQPNLNIPVVAPLVCSVKGYSWFSEPDALYGVDRPGCYDVDEAP